MGPETPGPMGLIGRVIGGYRLERVLGTGETSAVLLGQHVDAPEQQAVLKILMPPSETSAAVQRELRGAFSREAQTHFALQHPHIVGIYAFGVDVVTGSPYMVLPYPHGGSLAEHCRFLQLRRCSRSSPMPWMPRTLSASCTAMSARPTSCSTSRSRCI
jgi:serine/threonine protein kinase